jgi:hypothetical protein
VIRFKATLLNSLRAGFSRERFGWTFAIGCVIALSVVAPVIQAHPARPARVTVVNAVANPVSVTPLGPTTITGNMTAKPQLSRIAAARISEAIGRDGAAFRAIAQTGRAEMRNPDHGISASFIPAGVEVHSGLHRLSLREGHGFHDSR